MKEQGLGNYIKKFKHPNTLLHFEFFFNLPLLFSCLIRIYWVVCDGGEPNRSFLKLLFPSDVHPADHHERLTDAHFDLTPRSRMRNSLAEEVLDERMLYLMEV